MEVQILDAMRRCRKEIEVKALKVRCAFRANEMGTVARKYQRALGPHDFYLRMEDVCRIPDIRKVIIDGTDEEFSTCVEELTSKLPKLTSQILKERTAKISALLPFKDRPGGALSLATAWFNCGLCYPCYPDPMHGTDVLGRQCLLPQNPPPGQPIDEVAFDFDFRILKQRWCAETPKFTFSEVASTTARGLILDCGGDPETITLAEMNSKFHRFAFFKSKELVACSWEETVSSTGFIGPPWVNRAPV